MGAALEQTLVQPFHVGSGLDQSRCRLVGLRRRVAEPEAAGVRCHTRIQAGGNFRRDLRAHLGDERRQQLGRCGSPGVHQRLIGIAAVRAVVVDAQIDMLGVFLNVVALAKKLNARNIGHTGIMEAAVKAVEAVDECVGRMVDAILAKGGQAIITADHGNADCLIDPVTKAPFTAHTTNPVPMILVGAGDVKVKNGRLCDLCPTMLDLMGLEKPEQMTGESLIVK